MINLVTTAHYGIIWSQIYLHLVGNDINLNNANEVSFILG